MKNGVVVYSRFQRNIFTRNAIWLNRDKLDGLVFKICVAGGLIALCLPWGAQA